jgi:outer membrane protein assembly factor BamE (lipoprotein component of BamABCDE complex)
MKTNRVRLFLFAALGAFCLAGCSTPATRIKANPEVFARLTPQQQALVQAGQIALGFDAEAVKLALGDPDRISVRTDADGETAIWHYVSYEAEGRILFRGYYHTGRRWGGWGPSYAYYLDYPNRRARDHFRVELRRGMVTAITEDRSN